MLFRKKRVAKPSVEEICKNCQTQFKGKYCPECGQAVDEHDRPFSILIYDFLGDFIAFDSRFYKTFIYLVKRPGFLTNEYFNGRQVRYSPPIKVFIFTSFVLFFLLQIQTTNKLSKALSKEVKAGKVQKMNQNYSIYTDSLISNLPVKLDSVLPEENLDFHFGISEAGDTSNISGSLTQIAEKLEKRLSETTDIKKQQKLRTYISLCRSPEQAVDRIFKYVSWAFFLLLPLFALVLKLFYIRRKQNYIRHLVFSIHLHSFWFTVMIFVLILNLIFKNVNDWIIFFFFLCAGIYFIIALKKFYGQGSGKTILKFFGISFIYFFVLTGTVLLTMLNALSLI
jgi:hypothetical protein